MVGGGILAALVLTPAIAFFGENLAVPLPPGTQLIKDMGPSDIFRSYVRYIGAGAVAAAGIISLCKALPLIVTSITGGLRDLRVNDRSASSGRTQRDLPFW